MISPFFGVSDEEWVTFVFVFIVFYNSLRERCVLTRSAIMPAKYSPWKMLLLSGDDQSFLTMTGFTRKAFWHLEKAVFPEGNAAEVVVGRPRALSHADEIGLTLLYLNSKMQYKHLSMIFGVLPTTVSDTVRSTLKRMIQFLRTRDHSAIKFPNEEKMAELAELVRMREPLVENVIGFVDGVSIPVQCPPDDEMQARYYNGYHHDTMVNNVFAFGSDGKIIYAAVNYPGSWHDAQVSQPLMDVVISKIGNYALCVDQGFPRNGELTYKFVGPLSAIQRRRIPIEVRAEAIRLHELYVSLRQAAEWGMRALQGTFARLKSRLTSNPSLRRDILLAASLLHNFRTHYVGLNQIAAVFNPHYEQYINLANYDRIARYFNFAN